MPGGDGTGPNGLGPMTGRGLGPCGRRSGYGRGFGRGLGYGRRSYGLGYANQNSLTLTKEEEKKILEEELKELESEKTQIEKRLKELE